MEYDVAFRREFTEYKPYVIKITKYKDHGTVGGATICNVVFEPTGEVMATYDYFGDARDDAYRRFCDRLTNEPEYSI